MNDMMNLVINQIVIKLNYRDDWIEFIDIYSNTILLGLTIN
ncbi:TPA: hypothetical protein O6X65_001174 [Staphylococcus aureus]|uniref:Uncharacterized protein n=1 Tax=Staphylococcus aureus TaxID=1280 RepID=A0A6A9GWF8_STAAU|nr:MULTISPECIES: hypothetical protein [Staphylococcus]HDH6233958.1 hypothetical protein [Staphylococcus aureus LTCF-11-44]HDK8961696.1 hypothetical protein [Staphylococcus aureus USA1000-94318]HDQ3545997.1 hypothetical protein [Staphylococcus aureus USA1000-CA-629]AGW33473.1 hypothetical protein SA957_0976 [Staphylococcus aureus subsp. aureus SA957]AGW36006.1 hypothetical protein SA40_0961 [Staphylococcus aureus subsp. aureus SA40]